jgi:hypothetical protein
VDIEGQGAKERGEKLKREEREKVKREEREREREREAGVEIAG